jgi:hypothetical protein
MGPTITLISGMSKSKAAMACSRPSFRSFLSDSCYNVLSKLYADNGRGTWKLGVGALKKCLADMMLSLPGQGQIYFTVDALDECPNFLGTAKMTSSRLPWPWHRISGTSK